MNELDKVLESDEKVIWEDKPNFWPFFLGSFALSIFGLIFVFVGGFILFQGIKEGNWWLLFFPHFWVGLAIVFGPPIYQLLVYSRTHYAVTNKRVILQGGVIGRDFKMADFDQITNAEVDVGIMDKIFGGSDGSGSILISTAGTFTSGKHGQIAMPYTLKHVNNPYEVFKLFKKVSHAVKTDINYPNEYRPAKNKGYNTEYSA